MKNYSRYILCLLILPFLVACAEGMPGFRPLTYADSAEARIIVSGSNCMHTPRGQELAPLVAAFVTGAASKLLENFGTALSDAAKGGALPPSTSTANFQVLPGQIPKCIVVIRGTFSAHGSKAKKLELDRVLWTQTDQNAADMSATLAKLDPPDIYSMDHFIELQLVASKNGKAMTFAPVFAWIGRSIGGDKRGNRDFSISLKFNRPGADATGGVVVLSDMQIGESRTFAPDSQSRYVHESPWFLSFHQAGSGLAENQSKQPTGVSPSSTLSGGHVAPIDSTPVHVAGNAAPASDAVVGGGGAGSGGSGGKNGGQILQPSSGNVDVQAKDPAAVPVTATATVVETRPERGGLAFIAAVFTGVEPKLNSAVTNMVDTSSRRQAQFTSETSTLEANATYSDAQGKAWAAVIAYCGTASKATDAAGRSDRVTKSSAARSAQFKANDAALKAGVPPPFGQLIEITDAVDGGTNVAYCSNLQ
ncbi:hypothetical protein [Burkholderia cepacia]|uniref:hypothetical protein n=1 Tax=Burkholderia cepacia TaxID=292 RepID=UPI001CF100A0|nr:hypothetical protein [Burkholderia cepacia]MCA8054374.1 hypothetical protein [Burkholderia cepacia]